MKGVTAVNAVHFLDSAPLCNERVSLCLVNSRQGSVSRWGIWIFEFEKKKSLSECEFYAVTLILLPSHGKRTEFQYRRRWTVRAEPGRAEARPAPIGGQSGEHALSQETLTLPLAWKVPSDGQRRAHCREEEAHSGTTAAGRLEAALLSCEHLSRLICSIKLG